MAAAAGGVSVNLAGAREPWFRAVGHAAGTAHNAPPSLALGTDQTGGSSLRVASLRRDGHNDKRYALCSDVGEPEARRVETIEGETETRARHAVVVGVWTVIGVLAVLGGLAGIVTSVAGSSVAQVPVEVTTPAEFGGVRPCAETEDLLDAGVCETPPGWRADLLMISMPPDGLTLDTFDAPWLTRLLAWAPIWLGLLTGGSAVLVLVPVIRNIARGTPFADSATARLASAAGVVAVGWAAATLGWFLAARREVDRLEGLGLPAGLGEGWVAADLRTVLWPLIVVVMLATLAAASRRGAALTAETEGLV